ncbi:helix-turn-helix domain-containing protein [Massilia glaciei]|uniref:XRE family transcriptional regulator n=1 Tax=Massilia glaciei TaxID=1524097 RepID=A0A2U2HP35_9BURK|nr:helix-turn-helix transcriptional regulator [Massilia glaciei]PWF49267.1 XRE family transcriptional regulator [Massilia glaciei]
MQTSKTHKTQAPPAAPRKAVLRIQVLMAEHEIRFVTELWTRLHAMGVEISHSQLTRVVNNSTKSLSIDLLEGLATLFDCPVSNLFKDA